jgi:acetyltransferase-like isoleucine patch superfamily enzyme
MTKVMLSLLKISIIKTLCLNLRWFGLRKGFTFPVVIFKHVHISVQGKITSNDGRLYIGAYSHYMGRKSLFYIKEESQLILEGKNIISEGTITILEPKSCLTLKGGNIGRYSVIRSLKKITIGKDYNISWDVTIMDSDTHPIFQIENSSIVINEDKEIRIGEHVWVSAGARILKGSNIQDGAVIAAGSIISKTIEPHSLAGGINHTLKNDIFWER